MALRADKSKEGLKQLPRVAYDFAQRLVKFPNNCCT